MDIHHESEFSQSEQIPNNEVSILDSNNNVCVNGVGIGIDMDNNINVAEGFDDLDEFWGSLTPKDNLTTDKDVIIEGVKKAEDVIQLPQIVVDENNLVPSNCVSMFADIFGPPDDIYESEDKCIKGNCENILLNEIEVEEKKFVLGDIVWVKTKTKLWWPGIITDPSNASKRAPKASKSKDYFLVKQFAYPSSMWASLSELKDFTCYFEEMVKQNKSRNFYGAVERAVNEIGCNVKEKMTCSCFRKEIESSDSQPSFDQISTGAFSLSHFQPAQFLSFIQYLALDVAVPQKIQVTVTQNCLSAFYRSLGHRQMEIDQLRSNNTKDSSHRRRRKDENVLEEEENFKKRYELREKKVSNEEGKGNESSMKGLEKCVFGSTAFSITKIINSPSDTMLNDLYWTAVDDSSSGGNASLKRFFSCFRRFAFLKHEDGSSGIQPDEDNAVELPASGIKPKRKWQRKPKIISAVNEGDQPEKPKTDDAAELPSSSGIKPKRKWQRKPKINSESKDSSTALPDLNANAVPSSVEGFQITGHDTSCVGGFHVGNMGRLPPESMFTNNGVGWLGSNGNSMTFVQLLNDVQTRGGGSSFLQNIWQSEGGNQINFASESSWRPQPQPQPQPEANQINFASQRNTVAAPPPAPERKKRKRKPKEKVTSPPPIPDLNGTIGESSATEKPPRKRSKQVCVQLTPSLKVTSTLHPSPRPVWPTNGFKTVELPPGFGPHRSSSSNTPDLAFIKQKLEIMKSTLEKSGNNLSAEVRGKLEGEINGFSVKVNSMFGSSS